MSPALQLALNSIRSSQFIVLIDDALAKHRYYLLARADTISESQVAVMISQARGIILAAMPEERVRALGLAQVAKRAAGNAPDFLVSVESRHGVTTGISAKDRATTLRTLTTTTDSKKDLVMPGHIFPVLARHGGVLVRHAPAEAAVDLLQLAGANSIGAIVECLDEFGELLDNEGAVKLGSKLKAPLISSSELIQYRLSQEKIIEKIAQAQLPTKTAGLFSAIAFRSLIDDAEHLALIKGEIENGSDIPVLVRVQSEHRIGDLLSSSRLKSRNSIHGAMRRIEKEGRGIFVYVRHPKQGLLETQVRDLNENPAIPSRSSQLREYGIGAQILTSLGANKIRLLTNTKRAISGIEAFHISIVDTVSFDELDPSRDST